MNVFIYTYCENIKMRDVQLKEMQKILLCS